MKISLVNSLYFPDNFGGAERFTQTLAESLVEAGHQVAVIALNSRKGIQSSRVNGVKVHYLELKNLYWPFGDEAKSSLLKPFAHVLDIANVRMSRQLARIVDEERPEVVHTNNLAGFSVLVWNEIEKRRLPLVHTLHDHYLLCPRGTMFRNGRNCERRCAECLPFSLPKRRPSDRVDTVVGVSRFMLERHLEFGYFEPSRKEVAPNPYEAAASTPSPPELPIRFGYLGQLSHRKGIKALLEQAASLPEGSWSLDIAGRGITAEYERGLRLKHESRSVRFRGYTTPEDFFSRIDVLVVPSLLRESFGRGVIEAHAHGVPAICSDRGGLRELVREGGTGFLFDPDLPGDLKERMMRFIRNPSLKGDMRPRCLEEAEGYSPKNIAGRYLDLYAGAMERARHP